MEDDEWRRRRNTSIMDLNLYLGPPVSPLPSTPDLGSDLALGSAQELAIGEAQAVAVEMPVLGSTSDGNRIRFPSLNTSFVLTPTEPIAVDDYNPSFQFSRPVSLSSTSPVEISENQGRDAAVGSQYSISSLVVEDEPMIIGDDDEDESQDLQLNEANFAGNLVSGEWDVEPYQLTSGQTSNFFGQDGGSSSRQVDTQRPEFRLHTMIESHRRVRARTRATRRFRSSLPYSREQSSGSARLSFPTPDVHLRAVFPEASLEMPGKNKMNEDDVGKDGLEEKEKKGESAAIYFECNICFEVAKEPVVTSCGHLFCWSCLYLWLYQYSDHKECPACKGRVNESGIIPIYGRGNPESADVALNSGDNGDSDPKIPPRPHGRRLESIRQRIQRPIFRRPGDGAAYSLRHSIGEELLNIGRSEGLLDPNLNYITGRLDEGFSNQQRHNLEEGEHDENREDRQVDPSLGQAIDRHMAITRMRARVLQLMMDYQDSGLNPVTGVTRLLSGPAPQILTSSSVPQGGINSLGRNAFSTSTVERLTAIHADLRRLVGRFSRSHNHSVPPELAADSRTFEVPSVVISQNPEIDNSVAPAGPTHSADQASASSTMAVIQDDAGATDTSAEPNRAWIG